MDGVILADKPSPDLRCIACRAALMTRASLADCPRCGTDNRTWVAWIQAGRRAHLKRFLLGSPWGRLALVSLLLPLTRWVAADARLLTFETAILAASLLLSLAGLFLLFARRDSLWIAELARPVSPGYRPGLLIIGGIGFLAFIGMIGMLFFTQGLQGTGWLVLPAGLALTTQTLATGLYAVYGYGCWSSRVFPHPVFLEQAHLLELVMRTIKPHIQVKSGTTYEAVATQVVTVLRTDRAGLNLVVRSEAGTDKVWEGRALKAIQHWRVITDQWGRVMQFEQTGPLEYLPGPRLHHVSFDTETDRQVLEGEILLPS